MPAAGPGGKNLRLRTLSARAYTVKRKRFGKVLFSFISFHYYRGL
jgi:hypothetical protein